MLIDILCHMLGDKTSSYIMSLVMGALCSAVSGCVEFCCFRLCGVFWYLCLRLCGILLFPVVGSVAAAVQTARYCGSGLNMMLLLFILCLWE